jgi:hypothetical protein
MTGRYSTYQVSPKQIAIKGGNGQYSSLNDVTVVTSPHISFGIAAEDKNVATSFRLGIYEASIVIDDTLRSSFKMDDISYDETRYLNASIDYKTKFSGGGYIQHLSRLPGNQSTIFIGKEDGDYVIKDSNIHTALVTVKDAAGNTSVLSFKFRYDPAKNDELMFAMNSVPMHTGIPNEFKVDDFEAKFSPVAFYDMVPFVHMAEPANDAKVVSSVHHVHNHKVPVHDFYTARVKTNLQLSEQQKDRVIMHLVSDKKKVTVKGKWFGDFMEGNFRDFGTVRLVVDTIPPKITLAGWVDGGSVRGKKSITIAGTDNMGEVVNFKALVDNKWIMFKKKDNLFIHTFDGRIGSGRHEMKVY